MKIDFLAKLITWIDVLKLDELWFIIILWQALHDFGSRQVVTLPHTRICDLLSITRDRYDEIVLKLTEIGIAEPLMEDSTGILHTFHVGLPRKYRTDLRWLRDDKIPGKMKEKA